MRHVLIDSPAAGPLPHWSAAFVAGLADTLRVAGTTVLSLSPTSPRRAPRHRVAAGNADLAAELALTRTLRDVLVVAVVQAGAGAGGSPNLLWLAPRLGSTAVAVVRTAEVVCQRGDLVDHAGSPCAEFADPRRCARCCGSGRRRPSRDVLANRIDLLVASLQGCASIWLAADDDAGRLEAVGVPRRLLRQAPAADLVAAVAAELGALSRRAAADRPS